MDGRATQPASIGRERTLRVYAGRGRPRHALLRRSVVNALCAFTRAVDGRATQRCVDQGQTHAFGSLFHVRSPLIGEDLLDRRHDVTTSRGAARHARRGPARAARPGTRGA
ncbi:hypothetical protein K1W54_29910, partial [Micromonospora sp. CPCC 205371]|nr:hypothetical protein [Micromonospora sp. CPCC 205371]